jgi:DNA-directed RNA polymerase subunit M/transcription elongation factor TFIIS
MGLDINLGTVIKCPHCGYENEIYEMIYEHGESPYDLPKLARGNTKKLKIQKELIVKTAGKDVYEKIMSTGEGVTSFINCKKCKAPLIFLVWSI